jgi:tetratricopeptide (TPR) repeat protein
MSWPPNSFEQQVYLAQSNAEWRLWLKRLDSESDNLRAALGFTIERGDAEAAMRLGRIMGWFWGRHGLLSEGRARWSDVLALAPNRDGQQARVRAEALTAAGGLAFQQGDSEAARAHWMASLEIFRELADRYEIACTLMTLGQLALQQQKYSEGRALCEQSLVLFQELNDKRGIGLALTFLGLDAWGHGDYVRAVDLLTESLDLARERQSWWSIAPNLRCLAWSRGGEAIMRQHWRCTPSN